MGALKCFVNRNEISTRRQKGGGGGTTEGETEKWRGAWEHEPWLKGRKGSKRVFGMCVKIKQTFRRKKSRLISSIKFKLNFNAEPLLDLFYKWWCFDLEAGNVHGIPELCSAVKLLYVLRFSCQTLFKTGIEYEKQRYLIPSCTYPNSLCLAYMSWTKGNIFCPNVWGSQSCSQAIKYHCFGISPDISSADWIGTI